LIWWVSLPVRAQAERAQVGDLAERVSWLKNVSWRPAAEFQLAVDFDLEIGERTLPFTLLFPAFFPDAAPSVFPRDGQRLSSHQYGPGGELCLQYRPDNWSPDITGAMMIESAHSLLSMESETGEAAPATHRTSSAQHVRGKIFRFLLTEAASEFLAALEEGHVVEGEVTEHGYAGCYAAQFLRLGAAASSLWTEPAPRGGGASSIPCWVVPLGEAPGRSVSSMDELTTLLTATGLENIVTTVRESAGEKFVILVESKSTHPLLVFGARDARKTITYDVVRPEPEHPRVDAEYTRAGESSVAVVGCGSVGSKVAAHLARAGFRRFVLVDGDLLASGNLARNELDWRAVGLHKAPALEARLKEIAAGCEVKTSTIVLGGQESASGLASAMSSIESCDVIVEAAGDPEVFNLCAAISRRARKPLCWARVYGGGLGGTVVRLRPDVDPTPNTARRRIKAFCDAQDVPVPAEETGGSYSAVDDGAPLIADDADVAVIAAHVARMVIDLVVRPDASLFPYSAYLIGLRDAWLFSAPFDVCPVDLGASDAWGADREDGAPEALQQLLSDLFPKEVAHDAS
jgi:sulfur-carrier protein adenylyltransferase/sulfurtransferase